MHWLSTEDMEPEVKLKVGKGGYGKFPHLCNFFALMASLRLCWVVVVVVVVVGSL